MMTKRVKGHGLQDEGRVISNGYLRNGTGYGRCECGAHSPVLPSTQARKRWHRGHKEAVAT